MRLWKIPEESQLVFRGGGHGLNATEELVVMDGMRKTKTDRDQGASGGSIDVVAMIDEDLFLTGSDSGAISLWNTTRKKPIFTKFKAHGESSDECRWITSLAAVPHSDLFASGSADGMIRLWKISPTKRSFSPLLTIPMTGFINSMKFFEAPDVSVSSVPTAADKAENKEDLSRSQKIMLAEKERQRRKSTKKVLYLAAGVGQEHRLGRWWRVKEARNAVKIIKLA